MITPDLSNVTIVVDKIFYITLSILGIYFIYQGNVIQKFNAEKTFFAEYDEPVTEFPSIITHFDGFDGESKRKFKYGKDFNISYCTLRNKTSRFLTYGENQIDGSKLKVRFERIFQGEAFNTYKITPTNYQKDIPLDYDLRYTFDGTIAEVPTVDLQLVTETGGSLDDKTYTNNDAVYQGSVGRITFIIISALKYKYLDTKGCINKSYNELLLQALVEEVSKACETPCKPIMNLGSKKFDKILDRLPNCTRFGNNCYKSAAREVIKRNINVKPCTTLQYKGLTTAYDAPYEGKEILYRMVFANPPKFNVKEEYLIYDGIALISSIGGTLGLCIGFSFYNLSDGLLGWLRKGIKWVHIDKVGVEKRLHDKIDDQKRETSSNPNKIKMDTIESRFAAMNREMQELAKIMSETRQSKRKW